MVTLCTTQNNSLTRRIAALWHNPLFRKESTLLYVWLATAIVSALAKLAIGKYNNYKIFEGVYNHAFEGLTLYGPYPEEYGDMNHYGIIFSFIIAPFACLPEWIGMIMWVLANTLLLFYAVRQLPLSQSQRVCIYWVAYIELMTAQLAQQFNISVAAFAILAFVFIEKKKDFWAAFVILLGTFVKIYSIAGLAFFLFSKQKIKLVLSCLFWAALFLVLPALCFGTDYMIEQYQQWAAALEVKNLKNMFALSQNVSLVGLVRKVSGSPDYSDLWIIAPGILLFCLPYLRIQQYKHLAFRMMLLANVLLFIVLFSSGSEASSYVSAMLGVGIWYVCSPDENKKFNRWLLIATIILVAISTTELVPAFIRNTFIRPYVTKSWLCIVVWFKLCYEMIWLDFGKRELQEETI